MSIAALLMVLDIPNVLITGNFGPDGGVMIPYIRQEVDSRIISAIEYTIDYYPLEQLGFAYGAALLIFYRNSNVKILEPDVSFLLFEEGQTRFL